MWPTLPPSSEFNNACNLTSKPPIRFRVVILSAWLTLPFYAVFNQSINSFAFMNYFSFSKNQTSSASGLNVVMRAISITGVSAVKLAYRETLKYP
jgi:hypothetical protein